MFSARAKRPLPWEWVHRSVTRMTRGPLPGAPVFSPAQAEAFAWTVSHRQNPLEVLWILTRTDFRARYRSQALGMVWSLLHPLVMMALLSFMFTHLFKSAEPHFPVFLLIGLLIWQWVTGSLPTATNTFVANADIVKRTIFARHLLPFATVLSFGIHFCLESTVLLVFVPIYPGAFHISPALLLVPVYLLLMVVLLSGLSLATSVLNVIYRDVAYLVNTALLLLYWLTPVFYPPDILPPKLRFVLWCNPIAAIVTALRRAIMQGQAPSPELWLGMLVPTVLVFLFGWAIYRHYEPMALDYV